MTATQAQYDAATKALLTFAFNMINAEVPDEFGLRDKAKQAADTYCAQAAKIALDAGLAVTATPPAAPPPHPSVDPD